MCGIAGVLHLDGAPADRGILERMTRVIAHRGPDGEGHHLDRECGLGHRRLRIIDLSENGAQPMRNEDDTLWITFNGEIYNFLDLRADLEAKGHPFRSRSDTETILHGFEEYGPDVVRRLNGMFAFAIWNARDRTLFLARDRLGIKPLFYGLFGDVFLFGSEGKAIHAHPAARRELDIEGLDLFLSLNYVPAPRTLLKGVRQLEPGHWLVVRPGSRSLEPVSWWDIPFGERTGGTPADRRARFRDLLKTAVRRQLVSDVPLGAFLSGGLDSSAIVACMTDASPPGQVKTFSMGFGERTFNEAPYARIVAEHLGTAHHERIATPDLATILPKIVWHGEDPVADSSMIPVYYLSQMTREHVTVALTGDGADEILAGYPTYPATRWAHRLEFLPDGLAAAALGPILRLLPISDRKISWRERVERFVNGVGLPWRDAHAVWREIHSGGQKKAIVAGGAVGGREALFRAYREQYDRCGSKGMLDQMLYVDTRFYLPNDMLAKVDRMSMAVSLEARVPYLDHELVEFAAALPDDEKLRGGRGKIVLREVMADRLPRVTLSRQKVGFNIPVGKWLREDLYEMLADTLSVGRLERVGIWQPENIQKMVRAHRRKERDFGHQLWGLLTFMLWWERFVEGK